MYEKGTSDDGLEELTRGRVHSSMYGWFRREVESEWVESRGSTSTDGKKVVGVKLDLRRKREPFGLWEGK